MDQNSRMSQCWRGGSLYFNIKLAIDISSASMRVLKGGGGGVFEVILEISHFLGDFEHAVL